MLVNSMSKSIKSKKILIILGSTLLLHAHSVFATNVRNFRQCENSVAWQIIDAENHRNPQAKIFDQVFLPTNLLPNKTVGFAQQPPCKTLALQALGRIGSPTSVPSIARQSLASEESVKQLAAFALGLIDHDSARSELRIVLQRETSEAVLATAAQALGRIGTVEDLRLIASQVSLLISPANLSLAVEGLGILWMKDSSTWQVPDGLLHRLLELNASSHEGLSVAAAFALARFKGDATPMTSQSIVSAFNQISHLPAKSMFVKFMGKTKRPELQAPLCETFNTDQSSVGLKIEIMRSLANFTATGCSINSLDLGLSSQHSQIVFQSLESLKKIKPSDMTPFVTKVEELYHYHSTPWIRLSAAVTLATIAPDLAKSIIEQNIHSMRTPNLVLALKMIAGLTDPSSYTQKVMELVAHQEKTVAMEAITTVSLFNFNVAGSGWTLSPEDLNLLKTNLRRALGKKDLALASLTAELVAKQEWTDLAGDLATAYLAFTSVDAVESKLSILSALAEVGSEAQRPLLFKALGDTERLISAAAADAIFKLYQEDVKDRVPTNSRIIANTPSIEELNNAISSRIVFRTNRGSFSIALNEFAPLTSANITRLVRTGFYNQLPFHRIVPNFVAQGGDPRKDGYGGPGYLIRDEVSMAQHVRGAVGIATAGKDTGGSQFFVDQNTNPHLNHGYTVFGNVVAGLEVIDRLEQDDEIIEGRVY